MVRSIDYNGSTYVKRSDKDRAEGYVLATTVSGAIMSGLMYAGKPFQKQLTKEHSNNHLYKDALMKALEISGLKKKGVDIIPAQHEIGRMSAEAMGTNACYIPSIKQVKINTDKISIAGFHELGHAMNHLKSKLPCLLQKMRGPGYAIAGLMEYFALFSRTKPKGQKRDVTDVIEDNCGKIAFAALLPTVVEEAIASHKGIKLARKAGLAEPLIKNMKKLYGKALLTYGARAVLGGLAVWASRKIMDKYTRPVEVKKETPINIDYI